ncbi:thiamine diphosphokinase [Catenisphaera adipataccumulans]|uniref:Thiamine diphosphokinase n=1 Tax=Catenisphaera adipataccumulans TaxID=700500 RepID=A0A7W8FXG3_9FIRM|nr:thiamine diphosphokinase [Catenisphaera adipataccumulans]MBB5183685.1 thiamine pyrophosphokinase [Catenisphaera adipataccumulans]
MKRAVLITPMVSEIVPFDEADYIGVDAGALLLLHKRMPMKCAVGDFDSMDETQFKMLEAAVKIYQHPVMKNETDSELAIRLCIENGYDDVILEGGLNGRIDHTIANLRLLMYRYPQVTILDGDQMVRILRPGTYRVDTPVKHVSFFAVEPSVLTLRGFLYPLEHRSIVPSDIFTVSNSLDGKEGQIIVEAGKVLYICSNER